MKQSEVLCTERDVLMCTGRQCIVRAIQHGGGDGYNVCVYVCVCVVRTLNGVCMVYICVYVVWWVCGGCVGGWVCVCGWVGVFTWLVS